MPLVRATGPSRGRTPVMRRPQPLGLPLGPLRSGAAPLRGPVRTSWRGGESAVPPLRSPRTRSVASPRRPTSSRPATPRAGRAPGTALRAARQSPLRNRPPCRPSQQRASQPGQSWECRRQWLALPRGATDPPSGLADVCMLQVALLSCHVPRARLGPGRQSPASVHRVLVPAALMPPSHSQTSAALAKMSSPPAEHLMVARSSRASRTPRPGEKRCCANGRRQPERAPATT